MAMDKTLTRFTPASHADYDALVGLDVMSNEGQKVGTVKKMFHPEGEFAQSVGRHYFLLEPGLLKDWFGGLDESYIPETAISGVTTDGLMLSLTEDEIKSGRWERPTVIDRYREV